MISLHFAIPILFASLATSFQSSQRVTNGRLVNSGPIGPLFSLQPLIDEIRSSSGDDPFTVFVGGKGGVGKTTISSALAVQLASTEDMKILICSTDPAHSLGDALDEDLRKSKGKPLPMTDPVTGGRLFACEVDAQAALDDFAENLAAFDVQRLASSLGVAPELLESFGLEEFSGLIKNPPPGLDELVALSNVLDSHQDFDAVIVDTAPTGHTLRLLQLPQFLDGLLGNLIKIRMKLSGLASTLQAFFGSSEAQERAQTIDDAMDRLEAFRRKMSGLRDRLQTSSKTRFMVVTVPTKLSVAESRRLVSELSEQDVGVTDVVINQCVGDVAAQEGDGTALQQYYQRRQDGQEKWIRKLIETTTEVSVSTEYRENGSSDPISVVQVPFFDVELVGVPALGYLGKQCLVDNPGLAHLMTDGSESGPPRIVICGGKGGVGKTTTSVSLAVSMAAKGHKVALISTDPAHSLGDAIDMDLRGGKLQDCPLIGLPPSDGSLSVLEIDPSQAIGQFKGIVNDLMGDDSVEGQDAGLRSTLSDLQEIFDTLPAGTDEVVALAKIVNIVKKGDFDRIVLDTAPTGHTLRMLSTPGFLAELIDRLLAIARKVNSNAALKMLVSSSARSEDIESAGAAAKSRLISFQLQMYDLEDMFADAEQTEFLIVTVATELAVRESTRLLNDLTFEAPDMPIKVRNVVVNQLLKDSDSSAFLSHLAESQNDSISDLKSFLSTRQQPPRITEAQYVDTEPRGVFGLKILADELIRDR